MNNAIKKVLAENLLSGEPTTKEGAIKMSPGSILSVAQYFAESLLPRIAINKGVDSPDYKNMFLAINACLLAVELMDREKQMREQYQVNRQLLKWTQAQAALFESELQKYTTIKELLERGTLEMFVDVVNGQKFDFINDAVKMAEARNTIR